MAEILPFGRRVIFTALMDDVMGLASRAMFCQSLAGNDPVVSSMNSSPEMPVPPTLNLWFTGMSGW